MKQRSKLYHPDSVKIQVCSFLSLLRIPLGLWAVFSLGIGFLFSNPFFVRFGLVGIGMLVLVLVVYFFIGAGIRCIVCTNPVFMSKRCTKNREARRFMGISYPMEVAKDALLSGYYRCMYCGERVRTEDEDELAGQVDAEGNPLEEGSEDQSNISSW
ncbi:MAG: hypothetical protein AAF591_18140 [Verrucomicrobiota bacterium]